jgi:3',5'-cyclic AMP phosphodiesterase CpdA
LVTIHYRHSDARRGELVVADYVPKKDDLPADVIFLPGNPDRRPARRRAEYHAR